MTKQIKTQAKQPRFVVTTRKATLECNLKKEADNVVLKLKGENESFIVFIDHKAKLKITYELDRKNYRVKQEVYSPEKTIESTTTDSNAGANGDRV